jgi:hypothetical protein
METYSEGHLGTWEKQAEVGNLQRMMETDCVEVNGTFCRMAFDLRNEPLHKRSAFVARRLFGETSKQAKREARDLIDQFGKTLDATAMRQILANKVATSWYARNAGLLPKLDEIENDEVHPESAISVFPLGKDEDGRLSKQLDRLLTRVKSSGFVALKKLGSACGTGSNVQYELLNDRERSSFWAYYRIEKSVKAPRHTAIGVLAIERAQFRVRNNQLTPTVKAKLRAFLLNSTSGLNETDKDKLWSFLKRN